MAASSVPDIVVGRLPLYLRALTQMAASGKEITSSQELGERLGISSAQIRKDLSQFGEFGKQGTGYNIAYLTDQLRRILKVDRIWEVALVGIGDLGRGVAHYGGVCGPGAPGAGGFAKHTPPKAVQVPKGVHVQYIDPVLHMQRMTYYLP